MLWRPAINPTGKFEQLSRYSHLGSSISEIIKHIVTHPIEMLRMFYESHIQLDEYDVVKEEFLCAVLFSGGLALLWRPALLWFALPIFMQKLWNKELAFWGISYHYQIELAPIIALAIIYGLRKMDKPILQMGFLFVFALSTVLTTYHFMQSRKAYFDPIKENIFSKSHYHAPFNVKLVQAKLAEIPEDSAVCAQANLLPHLAMRDKLYHFPYLKDAQYLVFLQPGINSYPLSEPNALHFIDSLRSSGKWQEDSLSYPLRIMKKK
jgi:uncharacterized membrane protein